MGQPREKIIRYTILDKMGQRKARCKGEQKPVRFKIIPQAPCEKVDLRSLLLGFGQTHFYRGEPYYFYTSSTELPKPDDARVWFLKTTGQRVLWLYGSDNLLALKRAIAPHATGQYGVEGENFGYACILTMIEEKDEIDNLVSDLLK